jgi:hypothetical protein
MTKTAVPGTETALTDQYTLEFLAGFRLLTQGKAQKSDVKA